MAVPIAVAGRAPARLALPVAAVPLAASPFLAASSPPLFARSCLPPVACLLLFAMSFLPDCRRGSNEAGKTELHDESDSALHASRTMTTSTSVQLRARNGRGVTG